MVRCSVKVGLVGSGMHFMVALFSFIFATPVLAQPTPTPSARREAAAAGRPLPLDPLSPEEQRAAEQIALADPRVRELLGTAKRQLVSVDLFARKPPEEQLQGAAVGRRIEMGRMAEVMFFRYEGEYGVRAVVDLEKKTATDVSRLESAQVPMTPADLAQAWTIALRSDEVRKALGPDVEKFQVGPGTPGAKARPQYSVEALRVGATDEKDPCFRHRCLHLLFREGDAYLMKPWVIVDLSAEKVYIERRGQ